VTVWSEEGVGSTFTLRIPLASFGDQADGGVPDPDTTTEIEDVDPAPERAAEKGRT
jgi:two-component system sensor histidine kinase SenX3